MPELPEAETIVRDLRGRVIGRSVTGVQVTRPDILASGLEPARLAATLTGRRIEGITRRGKKVVLLFNPGIRLVINLGMTGRVIAGAAPRAAEFRHVAVRFDLDDGQALLYDDSRRFGRLELFTARTWPAKNASLGVEPLSPEFTPDLLHHLTSRSRSPIRNWLLDQRGVAGIGNIYASEALFRASLHPARPANSLSAEEAARLCAAIRSVLQHAIDLRGTTISDYRDASGERGGFDTLLQVYDREGEPCVNCGTSIRRLVLTNRSAYFCPTCQRLRRTRKRKQN